MTRRAVVLATKVAASLKIPSSRTRGELAQRLADDAPDVIMVIEPDGAVGHASAAVEEVLGYRPGRFVGSHFSWHLRPDDRGRTVESLIRASNKRPGGAASASLVGFEARHADGSWRYLEALGSIWTTDAGDEKLIVYARDATERRALEDELVRLAFRDPLTGVANRALFMDRLKHSLARSARQGMGVSTLFLDLDGFKSVNDAFGHEVGGDRLLVTVSRRLLSCLRPGDTLARFGGDEFVVLLEGTSDIDEAVRIAGRMADALRQPVALDGEVLDITASIGVSMGWPGHDHAEHLIRTADSAMYSAKRDGKNRCHVFRQGLHRAACLQGPEK